MDRGERERRKIGKKKNEFGEGEKVEGERERENLAGEILTMQLSLRVSERGRRAQIARTDGRGRTEFASP